MTQLPIAISLGDPTGVGPEVTLKALAAELPRDDTRYLVVGNRALAEALNRRLALDLTFASVGEAGSSARLLLNEPPLGFTPRTLLDPPEARDITAAQAALAWLTAGARHCLSGEAAALVTAPVSKEAIIRAGNPGFVGQTEYLSGLAGTDRTIMMLLGCDDRDRWLRVALATTHVAIKQVASKLSRPAIELAIERAAQACRDLSLPRAKVAVCGLNPHAGEGGNMGDEELTMVTPAVVAARQRGHDVHGPFAADTLFHAVFRGDYDAVVAMYHDQGLVPLKMIAFESGVNWTLGLRFIRTSPDHGTAFDIAGQGIADPSSMIAALRLAKQLARAKQQPLNQDRRSSTGTPSS